MKRVHLLATGITTLLCAALGNHEVRSQQLSLQLSPQLSPQLAQPSAQWISLSAQSSPRLLAMGKQIVQQKGCNTCHGADLKGKAKFAPSIRSTGVMRVYNAKTFAHLMSVGLTDDGEKVKKPMPVYHMKAAQSNALYAYLKSLK